MIVILQRGNDTRVLRRIESIQNRQYGDVKYALFQPRAMFTKTYLSTYDSICVVGYGITRDGGELDIHWIKEPRYD